MGNLNNCVCVVRDKEDSDEAVVRKSRRRGQNTEYSQAPEEVSHEGAGIDCCGVGEILQTGQGIVADGVDGTNMGADGVDASNVDGTTAASGEPSTQTSRQYGGFIAKRRGSTKIIADVGSLVKVGSISQRYVIGPQLGEGSCGQVYHAVHIKYNIECAIKFISKQSIEKSATKSKQLLNELRAHERLVHEATPRTYELLHDDHFFFIVIEYVANGDMCQYLMSQLREEGRPVPEADVRIIAQQLFEAIEYMHNSCLIVHRDIKLDNILINKSDLKIKLIDFGFAHSFTPGQPLRRTIGSQYYISPDMLRGEGYDQRTDVWSATVVVYALLKGEFPYGGQSWRAIHEQIELRDLEREFALPSWDYVSDEAKDFLRTGLEKEPEERAFSEEMLQHAWLQGAARNQIEVLKTRSIEKAAFLLRAGHYVDKGSFKQLLEILLQMQLSEEPTKLIQRIRDHDSYSNQQFIQRFLRDLCEEDFDLFMECLADNQQEYEQQQVKQQNKQQGIQIKG